MSAGAPVEASVVIPTWNRRDSVLRTISAVAAAIDGRSDVEIVVSVDGSTDGTSDALDSLRLPVELRQATGEHGGRAAACNRGVAAARGRLVVLLDDDMLPSESWLGAHLRMHGRARQAVVGAVAIEPAQDSEPLVAYLMSAFERRMARIEATGLSPTRAYTGNFSIAREVFREAGGFDESFATYGHEDYDLAIRLGRAGVELRFAPEAIAHQDYRKTFRQLADDEVARGRTAVLLARKHPSVLPELELGHYRHGPRTWRALREVVLAAAARSRGAHRLLLAALAGWERHQRVADFPYDRATELLYWLGVRLERS